MMKTRNDIRLRQLGNRFMIVNTSLQSATTDVIALNSTAAEIWKFAAQKESFTTDDVVKFITDTYDIDPQTALSDASNLLNNWRQNNLITD